MTLYHTLKSIQSDRTNNRNVYMKDFDGVPTLFTFNRQHFCGDKIYNHSNGMEVKLNDLIEEAFQQYLYIENKRLMK